MKPMNVVPKQEVIEASQVDAPVVDLALKTEKSVEDNPVTSGMFWPIRIEILIDSDHISKHLKADINTETDYDFYIGEETEPVQPSPSKTGTEWYWYCPYGTCEYKSPNKSHVTRHIRSHTGNAPVECYVVPLLHHKNEKPFKCDLCGFKCISAGQLNLHIRSHSGERPCKCAICNYAFYSVDLIKQKGHKTTKNKNRLKCQQCDYSTSRPTTLLRHRMKHTAWIGRTVS